jgi:hypothetical protein
VNYAAVFTEDVYDDLVAGVSKMQSMGTILASPVVDRVIYFGSTDGSRLSCSARVFRWSGRSQQNPCQPSGSLAGIRRVEEVRDREAGDQETEEPRNRKPVGYFIIPRCAMPMLSRVLFFTRYIISSACRMTSCGVFASWG